MCYYNTVVINKLYGIKCIGNTAANLLSLPLRVHRSILRCPLESKKARPIKKILLMKMWGIGNTTILLPILKKIKEKHRDAEIYFLTLDSNKGLLESSPFVSRVFYFPLTTNVFKIAIDFIKYLVIFKKLKIELLPNFEQCNRLSVIFSYLTGARRRIGFEIARCNYNSLYSDTVKNDSELHVSQNFVNLARASGIVIDKYEYIPPEVDQRAKENVKRILAQFDLENKTMVALHVGSGENFKRKRWKNGNFAQLADRLITSGGACAARLLL